MIANEKLQFGFELGFKIARLESIWGSNVGFAQRTFQGEFHSLSGNLIFFY